ncbi:MAG TPA: hypothetical protein VGO89_13930, partial [Streptomyces sp.]|nr:hypothetical protein [Streptomyces sp.]
MTDGTRRRRADRRRLFRPRAWLLAMAWCAGGIPHAAAQGPSATPPSDRLRVVRLDWVVRQVDPV